MSIKNTAKSILKEVNDRINYNYSRIGMPPEFPNSVEGAILSLVHKATDIMYTEEMEAKRNIPDKIRTLEDFKDHPVYIKVEKSFKNLDSEFEKWQYNFCARRHYNKESIKMALDGLEGNDIFNTLLLSFIFHDTFEGKDYWDDIVVALIEV